MGIQELEAQALLLTCFPVQDNCLPWQREGRDSVTALHPLGLELEHCPLSVLYLSSCLRLLKPCRSVGGNQKLFVIQAEVLGSEGKMEKANTEAFPLAVPAQVSAGGFAALSVQVLFLALPLQDEKELRQFRALFLELS